MLASTSSALLAKCALPMFMIMCVMPGPLRAGTGGNLARHAAKAVGCGAHPSFGPPAVTRDSNLGDFVDDVVIARRAKQCRKIFILAEIGKDLGAGHPFTRKSPRVVRAPLEIQSLPSGSEWKESEFVQTLPAGRARQRLRQRLIR